MGLLVTGDSEAAVRARLDELVGRIGRELMVHF
jgi:hypothetical protein